MQLAELAGLIPEEVGECLAEYASRVPHHQAIVEIGSYKGKSTCYLASRATAQVWAIDAWYLEGNVNGRFGFNHAFAEFCQQVTAMDYWDRIRHIVGFGSEIAWLGPSVGLLFVDGDHSADAVESDVRAWLPRMAPGAAIILDDLDTPKNPGVRTAALRLSDDLGPFRIEAGRLAVWTL